MANKLPESGNSNPVTLPGSNGSWIKDCLSCRILGGGGLCAAAAYVFVVASRSPKGPPPHTALVFRFLLAAAIGSMGIVVLVDPVEKKRNN